MGLLRTNVIKHKYVFRTRDRETGETGIRIIEAESLESARLKIDGGCDILQESDEWQDIQWDNGDE